MKCEDFTDRLHNWLDTVLREGVTPGRKHPTPPEDLLNHADRCGRCASRLGTVVALLGVSRQASLSAPDLESRIISQLSRTGPRKRTMNRFLVPAASAAAAAACIFFVMLFSFPAGREKQQEIVVRFYLEAPSASSVALVGDWNDWDGEAHLLRDAEGDGIWETEIRLIPGREYRYQFFIDGKEWIADPGAPLSVDDGFGGKNSVLQL